METPTKVKQNLVIDSFKSAYDSIRQFIVDAIFDWIVDIKKRETIRKCIQYKSKFYMIQESSFKFRIFRRADMLNKVSFLQLSEAAIFVAYPHIHNLKNYKRNGKKR